GGATGRPRDHLRDGLRPQSYRDWTQNRYVARLRLATPANGRNPGYERIPIEEGLMSFLVVLLVLLIEKLTDWKSKVQHDGPWLRGLQRIEASEQGKRSPWLVLLLGVLLPVLSLGALLLMLEPL